MIPLSAAELPAGTALTVRLIDNVDTAKNTIGQRFRGSLDEPVVVDGVTVLPKGANVVARLDDMTESGRFRGKAMLALVLTEVEFDGHQVHPQTNQSVSNGVNASKRTAMIVGGAAAAGAVVAGVATGGVALGALAGAGGGAAFRVFRKDKPLRIPSESRVKFTLSQPLVVE